MKKIIIEDVGGFSDLKMCFMPGWSTGPRDGEYENGVHISIMFSEKRKFKKNQWSGSGVIKKEQAIKLAKRILNYYE